MITIRYVNANNEPATFVSDEPIAIIGRPTVGQALDLGLEGDDTISHLHACISQMHGEYWIEDLHSANGTWVDGERISGKTRLQSGAALKIGQTTLEVQLKHVEASHEAFRPEDALGPTVPPTNGVLSALTSGDATIPPGLLSYALRHLKAVYALNKSFESGPLQQQIWEILMQRIQEAFPAAHRGAVAVRSKHGELLLKTHWPPGQQSLSSTLAERALSGRQAFIFNANQPSDAEPPSSTVFYGVKSAVYAPLMWDDNAWGVVYVDNAERSHAFTEADLTLLRSLAYQVSMHIEIQSLRQHLRRGARIQSNLLRQFSPAVAKRLVKQEGRLRLGGERVNPVTILFSDIRGFTALSATMEPDDVVEILNEMYATMIPIVFAHSGMVDKYVGDSILAVFGSPEPDTQQWDKAVRAALEMQASLKKLARVWASRGLPVFGMGIGIHSGEVIHGLIGAPDLMEYTVIGDTVNRASRFCEGADADEIVISQSVYERVYRRVDVSPKNIVSKHPDSEPDMKAYVVRGLNRHQD